MRPALLATFAALWLTVAAVDPHVPGQRPRPIKARRAEPDPRRRDLLAEQPQRVAVRPGHTAGARPGRAAEQRREDHQASTASKNGSSGSPTMAPSKNHSPVMSNAVVSS